MKTKNIFKAIFITSGFTMLFHTSLSAQSYQSKPVPVDSIKQYAISWQPTSLLAGGLRFDFETRLNTKQWLRFAPTVYSFPSTNYRGSWYDDGDDYYYNTERVRNVFGLGIDADYKYYFNKRETIYLLGGIHYSYINYKYEHYTWINFEENNMSFYTYDKTTDRQHFHRPGAILCIGLQTPKQLIFFFDSYIGLGYRYSFYNKEKPAFDDGIQSPGFRGFYLAGGLRLGIAFGRPKNK